MDTSMLYDSSATPDFINTPVGSQVLVRFLDSYSAAAGLSRDTWDLAPRLRFEPRPLHWECSVSATGPLGKSCQIS